MKKEIGAFLIIALAGVLLTACTLGSSLESRTERAEETEQPIVLDISETEGFPTGVSALVKYTPSDGMVVELHNQTDFDLVCDDPAQLFKLYDTYWECVSWGAGELSVIAGVEALFPAKQEGERSIQVLMSTVNLRPGDYRIDLCNVRVADQRINNGRCSIYFTIND